MTTLRLTAAQRMIRRPCARLAEEASAFIDGAGAMVGHGTVAEKAAGARTQRRHRDQPRPHAPEGGARRAMAIPKSPPERRSPPPGPPMKPQPEHQRAD